MKSYKVVIDSEEYKMTGEEVRGVLNERSSKLFFRVKRQGGSINFPFSAIREELIQSLN